MPLLNTSVLLFSSSSSARTAQFLLVLALLGGAFGPLAPSPAIAQATWAEAIAGNSADRGRDLAVDDAGNSYVTGFFSDSPDFDGDGQADATSAGDYDIFVAKYNNAGTLQWVSTAGGSAGRDRGVGIALDDAGNSYVTGYFNGSADFDGDGQPEVTAVGGATDDDIFVAKYDDTGVLQWVRSAGSQFAPESGEGIAVTSSGDVLLTGGIAGNGDFDGDGGADVSAPGAGDIFVAKYDGSGTFQWANAAGGPLIDNGYGIDVDDAGNSYVTGVFQGSANLGGDGRADVTAGGGFVQNIFVAKYDGTGALLWANAAGGSMLARGQDIAVSGSGVSVVTGSFQGDADFDADGQTDVSSIGSADIFTAQYDASGGLQWVQGAGGTEFDEGFGIDIDADEAAYVTGYFQISPGFLGADFDGDGQIDVTSSGGTEVFVAKYSPTGALGAVDGAGGDFDDRGYGVGTDGARNVYVTGSFEDEADFDGDDQTDITSSDATDVFLARFDAAVLPVELIGFSAQINDGGMRLVWQTASETDNTGFFVERSTGEGTWSVLGFMEGAGTTDEPRRYRFTDVELPYDVSSLAYRLRQVDTDGTESISDPVWVAFGPPSTLRLRALFPNPARSHVTLRYELPTDGPVRLEVYDLLGRRVETLTASRRSAGRVEDQVDVSRLGAGMYFLRLVAGPTIRTQRFTVVR
jgi:hypothetical protein